MTELRIASIETEKKVLFSLKTLQALAGNAAVSVKSARLTGVVQVRKGQVVAASCGTLCGNGALLTLAAIGDGEVSTETTAQPVEGNVSLSLALVERLLNKLPKPIPATAQCNEEESLGGAIHLIYQFRRAEAGTRLVEVLRSNRFYYPAWLWHSRLMTRQDYIRKALAEARKWGNHDPLIQRETEKIEPQLDRFGDVVKRCIYCWSLMATSELRCKTCQGVLRIADGDGIQGSSSSELIEAVQAYEREFLLHPDNPRIAYCLCLGHYSLGDRQRAQEYVSEAVALSPKEPIFARAAALLTKKIVPAVAAVPPPTATVRPAVVQTPPSTGASKTILVVEDSQTSRKVISMLLGRKGYTIIEARNGSEALQKCSEMVPDLVLLDVMLPDLSGYEVLSRIRSSRSLAEVPVVMLTGKSKPSDRLRGLHHGSNEYLTKPFDPSKLLAVIEKYLDLQEEGAESDITRKTEETAPSVAVTSVQQTAPSPHRVEPKKPGSPATTAASRILPAERSLPVTPSPVEVSPVVQQRKPGQAEKKVLVVEDSPTSRKVISMVLAKQGYSIEEAPTGNAALRKLEAMLPNLILLDAMLPDMTGYDILHRLKNDPRLKAVPVVMLTAKNNPVDRQKGLKGGSVAYLTKPFDPEKLLAVINDNI